MATKTRTRSRKRRPASRKRKPPHVALRGPHRQRKPMPRRAKFGIAAGLLAVVTATFTIVWLTVGGVLWVAGTLLGGLATVMMTMATFEADALPGAVSVAKAAVTPTRRGKPGTARRLGQVPGSAMRRTTTGPAANGRARPVKGKRACSWKCQRSLLPKTTCKCSCAGKNHGCERGVFGKVRRASTEWKGKRQAKAVASRQPPPRDLTQPKQPKQPPPVSDPDRWGPWRRDTTVGPPPSREPAASSRPAPDARPQASTPPEPKPKQPSRTTRSGTATETDSAAALSKKSQAAMRQHKKDSPRCAQGSAACRRFMGPFGVEQYVTCDTCGKRLT